jgi:hypothetical protein
VRRFKLIVAGDNSSLKTTELLMFFIRAHVTGGWRGVKENVSGVAEG